MADTPRQVEHQNGVYEKRDKAFLFHFTVEDDDLRAAISDLFCKKANGSWWKRADYMDETLYRIEERSSKGPAVGELAEDLRRVLNKGAVQDGDSFGFHLPHHEKVFSKVFIVGEHIDVDDIEFYDLKKELYAEKR